jgi:hypothetical protein
MNCVALDRPELGECAIACMGRHLRSDRPHVYKFALPVRTSRLLCSTASSLFNEPSSLMVFTGSYTSQAIMTLLLSIIGFCLTIANINAATIAKPRSIEQTANVSGNLLDSDSQDSSANTELCVVRRPEGRQPCCRYPDIETLRIVWTIQFRRRIPSLTACIALTILDSRTQLH